MRSKVKVPQRSLWYATHLLMVMHIRTISQWTVLLDLFELFDLEVKGQGPTKVITIHDTPSYGHAPTYQLSLTYLERQKCYDPDKIILFKNNYLTLRSKVKVPRTSLRYVTYRLMVMHIRTICPWTFLLDLFELFDLEVKSQSPTKVITVRDTSPYDHAPTFQISLTYLERQKCYGPNTKILFKKQLFDLEVKGQGPMKVITVRNTPSYGHAPTYEISLTYLERQKSYGLDKLRWAEEKIRLKQYVSLRSNGIHKYSGASTKIYI